MRVTPLVAVVNKSTVLTDAEVENAMYAFKNAVHYQFRPIWNETCALYFYKDVPVPPNAWQMAILDDSDQAGALGYHDETSEGKPLAKIFAKTDKDYGYSWTVTFTHELFEMLADPYICLAAQSSNTEFYGYEVGDPVEADILGMWMKGADGQRTVLVSDFVTPAWFQPGMPGPYDWMQHCSEPLQLLEGGYASIFVSGKGWTQYQMKHGERIEVPLELVNLRFRDRSKKFS
jgi:hypothetical protein